ncbi:MAG: hypothetical protein K2W93_16985 [Burkholderiaceae bacterium]|nr:hypothetical protein [Burkholderiaceae bacterium]
MPIEVRQLLLKARVEAPQDSGDEAAPKSGSCAGQDSQGCDEREQLKQEILAECRRWLSSHLQELRER